MNSTYKKLTMTLMFLWGITLIASVYLNTFMNVKEIYLVWVLGCFLVAPSNFVLIPAIASKTFGQKNFNAIYGMISLAQIPSALISGYFITSYYAIGWLYMFLISCGILALGMP